MLKALELSGFKSFADKTRFEFPAGITVVVGPNGSGKSNVVDAIKWVLGEQSPKSLRGKEMADVIFKGGGDGARKIMNTAEATIIFDNSDRRLPIDAPEVHVTRRVFRSGEGEYLVNRQPCRLKDIKDMFRGTGVGADAYSLIEQGKVDQLLQASSRDRRAIFEEAAGISRFKAKKLETQRRLERVEQNLLRLSDIVEEVENRLRSVRAQASKARRYREYHDRLQQLRTQVGLADWRELSRSLQGVEQQLALLRDQAEGLAARNEALEAQLLEAEVGITQHGENVRTLEIRLAGNREQIAARESSGEHARQRCRELHEELTRQRGRIAAISCQSGDVQDSLRDTAAELAAAERHYSQLRSVAEQQAASLAEREQLLAGLRERITAQRAGFLEQARLQTSVQAQLTSGHARLATFENTLRRAQARLEELSSELRTVGDELSAAQQQERQADEQLSEMQELLRVAQEAQVSARAAVQECREAIAQRESQLRGIQERTSLLEEWETKYEGLSAGARDFMQGWKQAPSGPFAEVRGLVAEQLAAPVEWAGLIDAALGERAQYVVLDGGRLLDEITRGEYQPPGRVGFLHCPPDSGPREDLQDLRQAPGIVGRADEFVETAPEFAPLARLLLGQTWLAESLEHARRARPLAPAGTRFVTRRGELLDSDGALVLGQAHASASLVSRRSELRSLRTAAATLEEELRAAARDLEERQELLAESEQSLQQRLQSTQLAAARAAELRIRTRTLHERFDQFDRQRCSLEEDLQREQAQQTELLAESTALEAQLAVLERELATREEQVRGLERERDEEQRRLDHGRQDAASAQVELIRREQQVHGLRLQLQRFQQDQRQRDHALAEAQAQLEQAARRLQTIELDLLGWSAELAQLYLQKEQLASDIDAQRRAHGNLVEQRSEVAAALQGLRKELQAVHEQLHRQELAEHEIRMQRQTLADRLREDYGIELNVSPSENASTESLERTEVDEEIATLRKKIHSLGAVNLEALQDLDELEARFATLSGQHQDLAQAKETLERIIQRINGDSRRLFTETLEAIRQNFQNLYRRAFGGGKADIVLEAGADVLEGGVDIIATPPGKPSFNNSLLSGGEKALTAVALLLAIFEYRPSPFCVLDEVDAPFDEANIGRFIDVLRGFLDRTRFVIVTHSKKTMTAANTLYGVTMQESGVSKRVSVRFEDVSEDGRISAEAVARDSQGEDERGAA